MKEAIRRIPLQDFFRNPEKTAFQISPEGDFVSYLAPFENRMNLYVRNVEEENALRLTSEKDRGIAGYLWSNNNTLLYLKDFNGDENYHLYGVTIDGKDLGDLTPFPGVKVEIVDRLQHIDNEMLIGLNKRNPQLFDVYRLQVETGELQLVAENPGNISNWIADHDGKIRAAVTTDGVNTSLLFRETQEEAFKTILTTNFKDKIAPSIFTADNKNLYAISDIGRDKSALVCINPKTGEEIEELFSHSEVDMDGIFFSRKRGKLIYAFYTTWKQQVHCFEEEDAIVFKKLESLIEGEKDCFITSMNKAENRFLVRTISDRSSGSYYLFNVENESLTHLADIAPWQKEEELAEMKPISYQSRDGLTIHGYLTLPQGRSPQNLPVVVNPHGGPWHRDKWYCNAEVQFLANRGYAVLQMNFRGSTGYGKKFVQAAFKEWGKAMQNDITDGVKWLIDEGIADPKRIAIYGASYGGYATLAGLTFTPDLYACGIDYVGVSNLFTFLESIPPYWQPFLEMMYEMVGHPEEDKEDLHATSPVFHVDQIKVPLFVAQGAQDPRVKKAESDQIVQALKDRGVDVAYMVKDNEGHGFLNQENRFEFYEAMEEFLATHLQ